MSKCEDFEFHILDLISGEIDEDAFAELRIHARQCPDCADMIHFHERLLSGAASVPNPPRREMQQMRWNVVSKLRTPLRSGNVFAGKRWLPIAAMIAIFLIGALAGRLILQPGQDEWEERLTKQRAATSFEELLNNRYLYSNVDLRKVDDRTFQVGFDVSTRARMNLDRSSPLLSEILSQSILSSENLGLRLKNLGYAEKMRDPIVRDTLIAVLKNDSNVAVRLKTLSILREYPSDSIIEDAVLDTLRTDESVEMRLQALDFLVTQPIDPAAIIEAILGAGLESDPAVQIRAADYKKLNQMMTGSKHF
jgi:hypothetical protein